MVVVTCPIQGCEYKTDDLPAEIVVPLLNIHALEHSRPTNTASRGPKLNRPLIDMGVDEETWNAFIRRWETFRVGSDISDAAAPTQFFQCASEGLGDLLLKSDPSFHTKGLDHVITTMRSLAVIPVARGVIRTELLQMHQSHEEPVRTFAARVRGKAETCGFITSIECPHGSPMHADYTEEVIRDVLLAGICDLDIRRDALSMTGILEKSVNDVVSIIEGREMARNATPVPSSVAALSTYKRDKQKEKPSTHVPCPDCGKPYLRHRVRPDGGINKEPYRQCRECWRANKKRPRRPQQAGNELKAIEAHPDSDPHISQVSVLSSHPDHPKAHFHLSIADRDPNQRVPVEAIADTGAQSNVWGLDDFLNAGFTVNDLQPTSMKIRAANSNPMKVEGHFVGVFRGMSPNGEEIDCKAIVYVSSSVRGFYLSCKTMRDLFIIDNEFPTIGGCHVRSTPNIMSTDPCIDLRALTAGCEQPHEDLVSCGCPQRTVVPERPASLPFEPIPENNLKMKQWLLDRYASSTFNTCPHRALPSMSGPPMEIHIDGDAKPRVCNKPAPVPLHWQQRVYDDLIRDEALGVIERVPHGVPVTWCHRMVVTRKHDGTPRRTVDLSPLNKFCKRETFPAEAPFHLARRIPGKTWKTVTDAWNGYHSVPLRESDRHLTTFITPFGKWRYTRAPQGFLSSGDGYNRRFDAILSDFPRKERCVDDTIHYDDDLEDHWWRTIDLLSLTGAAGTVMNPGKFQFAVREADFAGFHVGESSIEPLPKYLDAIRAFPTPKSTKDIRSWFGLVNQVSNYAQLRDTMALFKPFLSPKYQFFWSPVLDKAFNESKEVIVDAIRKGVEIFDITRPTCLRPDWSVRGIGYFLLQKHCSCSSDKPDCCPDGWRITLAGSRFLSGAETRYAAVEGEALAIAWGLEQTRYFTQGCQDLLVVTDHKPLTKIFGDRTLDEISNTRLFRLKQRTLPWHFRVEHLPGTTNLAADAASRYPVMDAELSALSVADLSEVIITAAISRETEEVTSISWSRLAEETRKDHILSTLMTAIQEGFCGDYPSLSEYVRYRDSLYIADGVVLYQDRVVVPLVLRQTVLSNLHSAHQGVSSMQLRAQAIVFWPGMTASIQETRSRCQECNRNAPSQPPTPTEPAIPPSTPFEQVFSDFFEFGGHHYLVAGDRLSGWSEVFSTPSGSTWSGSRGLIACLRSLFSTFGVPEELSSDGGPEYTAGATKEFLDRWGVKHRVSSAYFPQSNGRAEVAVKATKRLMRANLGPSGTLDSDKFLRALLQLRNTPDPDCNLSPAQILFGRPIRDSLSFVNRLEKFSNPHIRPMWREAWSSKEEALRTRFTKSAEKLSQHAKPLQPLRVGDKCFVQNQVGNNRTKWDRTGSVVEVRDHDQYVVKVDGSGRLTKRNRRFLRAFSPASATIDNPPFSSTPTVEVPGEKSLPGAESTCESKAGAPVPIMLEPVCNQTSGEMADVPHVNPVEPRPTEAHDPPQREPARVPAMLRRLFPCNMQAVVAPEDGGRRSRRGAMNL